MTTITYKIYKTITTKKIYFKKMNLRAVTDPALLNRAHETSKVCFKETT